MTTNHDLAEQIEDLVRQHIDVLRTTAAAAITRAFATTLPREAARGSAPAKPVRQRAKAAPARAPEELVALGEKFYAVLCRRPGETMTTLAPQVGAAPRVLHVAVARLRRAGRVRSVGQRRQMRYFPMTGPATASVPAAAAA